MDLATAADWHHPHYIGEDDHWGVRRIKFKPFTGDEPEPVMPDGIDAAFDRGDRAARAEFSRIASEVEAARIMWVLAQHKRSVLAVIDEAQPALQRSRATRYQVNNLFASLAETADNNWRSTIMRLMQAREDALDAARVLDEYTYRLDQISDWVYVQRAAERADSEYSIAAAAGYDMVGWDTAWDDGEGSLENKLRKAYAEQDRQIRAIADLAGDPASRSQRGGSWWPQG